MLNIKAPERMEIKKPEELTEMQSKGWDYLIKNGWHIFWLDGYLFIDGSMNLENSFFLCALDSVQDWLEEIMLYGQV